MFIPQGQVRAYEKDKPKIYFEVKTLKPTPPVTLPVVNPLRPKTPVPPAGKKEVADPFAQGRWGGQCVEFAKKFLGLTGTWGYGGKLLPHNTDNPEVGDVVIFSRHVAVVIGKWVDGTLVLIESNIRGDEKITVGRQVSVSSPTILGFYHPD